MAVRNPTSYTTWIDETKLQPGEDILEATVDSVVNDQIFALDQTVLVLSWMGVYFENYTPGTTATVNYFYVRNKDMCDVAGVTNNEIECDFYAKCLSGNAGSTGAIILQSTAVANNTSTIAIAGAAADLWRQGDTINVKTNGIEDTLELKIQCTLSGEQAEGSGIIVYGLCLVAKET